MQINPELPCFLLGHSMGGLTVQTFLVANPDIAARFAGVVLSAPFFGMSDKPDAGKQWGVKQAESMLGELVLCPTLPVH